MTNSSINITLRTAKSADFLGNAEYELTANQERYIFAEIAGTNSFFIGVWYEITGRLDPEQLKSAISTALSRHTGCRTSFRRTKEGTYLAVVTPQPGFLFHYLSVSGLNVETIDAAVFPYLRKLKRFDHVADFHRFFLLDTGKGRQAFVLCQHHAVSDGRSLDIVSEEIARLYSDPAVVLPAVRAFHDVAPEAIAHPDDTDFWQRALSGVEDVPRFHRNLIARDSRPGRLARVLLADAPTVLRADLPELTPFSLLAAGFAAQIAGQTRQADVVFSIQSAGRYGFTDAIVTGSFSNAVPIRAQIDFEEPFVDLARRMHRTIRESLRHEALGYHRIQSLTGVRPDFALNLYPAAPELHFGGLAARPRQFLTSETDYGVNLRWHHSSTGSSGVEAYFDAAQVEPERISAFLDRAVALCAAAAAQPQAKIAELLENSRIAPPLPVRTLVPSPPHARALPRLFDLFRTVASDHAARPAIRFDGHTIRYACLADQVEDRASKLHAGGVRAGMKVGFLASRTPDFVIDMLALSRVGAAFAAFDTEYPMARIVELFSVLECDFVIASRTEQQLLLQVLQAAGAHTLDVSTTVADLPRVPDPVPPVEQDMAYYLFTSGTTGAPKAIGVGHGALPQFLHWQAETFNVNLTDRVTMLSGLAHDPVLRDVFLPLLHGAVLTIPRQAWLRNPRELEAWLCDEQPSIVHTTPAIGQLLCEVTSGKLVLQGTRVIFWGGDMLPGELVRQIDQANPDLEQVNFYGATETPQAALFYRHNRQGQPLRTLPVGRPAAGLSAEIIDQVAQPLDINELGEVRIRSPYLVQIIGRKPTAVGTEQVYDTGDLGYRLPDGAIQLVGRQDDQVSVRGYRVELSDVERHLTQIKGVNAACVLSEKDEQGRSFLFAHTVTDPTAGLDSSLLRTRMQIAVPSYMVPTVFLLHDQLPLLPNGKRNRTALRQLQKRHQHDQALAIDGGSRAAFSERTQAERTVINIFEQTTGLKVAHAGQSFVEIGADSLNYIQAMLRLEPIIPNLPSDWPTLPISALARIVQTGADRRGMALVRHFRWVQIEIPALLRAFAILAIVALHLRVGSFGGGGTFLLFMLTGYSLFRFQLPKVLSTGTVKGLLNPLKAVATTTVIVGLLMGVAKVAQGEPFSLAALFFVTNFLDFSAGAAEAGGIIWLWFIACYVQIMLLFAGLLALRPVRTLLSRHLRQAVTGIFLGSVALKFGLIGVFSPQMLLSGVPLLDPWNYMPSSHIPTILIGGIVYLAADGAYSRRMCMGLTLAYALAVGAVFSANQPLIFCLGVGLILFTGSMPIPSFLHRAFLSISGASLYIYLLHNPIYSFLRMAHLDLPPIGFFVLIVSGIVGLSAIIAKRGAFVRRKSKVIG